MSWIRVDDTAVYHKKQLAAGPAACWLWVCGLAYTQQLETDTIPTDAVQYLGVKRWRSLTKVLLKVGLWEHKVDGYLVHDLYDFHPTPDERSAYTLKKQAQNARYYRNAAKRQLKFSTPLSTTDKKSSVGDPDPVPDPVPDPSTTTTQNVVVVHPRKKPRVGAVDPGFETFWRAYPKKRSKHDAERAWLKLKPDEALQAEILAAVEAHCRDPNWLKDGGAFIPYPASWLNAGGWKDEAMQIPQVTERNLRSLQAIYGDD